MTGETRPGQEPHDRQEDQLVLDGPRLLGALALIGDLHPVLADVLKSLHLRVYPGPAGDSECSAYIVLDLHGVSIGAQRRTDDFYLHADTTETSYRAIAFEINGSGELDHPTQ